MRIARIVLALGMLVAVLLPTNANASQPYSNADYGFVVSEQYSNHAFNVYSKSKCKGHSAPVYPGRDGAWSDDNSVKSHHGMIVDIYRASDGHYLKTKYLFGYKCYKVYNNQYWVVYVL